MKIRGNVANHHGDGRYSVKIFFDNFLCSIDSVKNRLVANGYIIDQIHNCLAVNFVSKEDQSNCKIMTMDEAAGVMDMFANDSVASSVARSNGSARTFNIDIVFDA